MPVAIATNIELDVGHEFDRHILIKEEHIVPGSRAKQGRQWWTRTLYLNETPFYVTLQIDSDRTVCSAVDDVFSYACDYDMLHVSVGILPAFDNGVFVYRKGPRFQRLLDVWLHQMAHDGTHPKVGDDQLALARALDTFAIGDFKSAVLPPAYQVKLRPALGQQWGTARMPHTLVVDGDVKIVSGSLEHCKFLSISKEPRVLVNNNGSPSVAMSMDECNAVLKCLCIPKELNWQRRSHAVLARPDYLRRYHLKT